MKKDKHRNMFKAWLLLLTLLLMMIVKDFHHHEAHLVCSEYAHSDGSSTISSWHVDCPICHFMLSPMTEPTKSFTFAPQLYIAISSPLQAKKPLLRKVVHTLLRAPPIPKGKIISI